MAYRGLIPSGRLTGPKIGGKMTMWLGKGRSFLCYPVSSGRLINMVAFCPDQPRVRGILDGSG